MRLRGDRVIIPTGKYSGHRGTVDSNVHQPTVGFPDEFANCYHAMLDRDGLVTVRWNEVVSVDMGCANATCIHISIRHWRTLNQHLDRPDVQSSLDGCLWWR